MNLIDAIKRAEGFRSKPYRDTVGKLTIGYGHNLDDNGITEEVAALILERDVAIAVAELRKRFDWFDGLNDARKSALTEMVFNLGITKFMGFHHMLDALDAGDFQKAAMFGLNSLWHDQVGERAERIMAQLDTGEYR